VTLKKLQTLYKSYDRTFKRLSALHWELYRYLQCDANQHTLSESNAERWSSRKKLLKELDPRMGELLRHELEE